MAANQFLGVFIRVSEILAAAAAFLTLSARFFVVFAGMVVLLLVAAAVAIEVWAAAHRRSARKRPVEAWVPEDRHAEQSWGADLRGSRGWAINLPPVMGRQS